MRHAIAITTGALVGTAIIMGALVVTAPGCGKPTAAATSTGDATKVETKKSWDYVAELKKLTPGHDRIAGWKVDGEPTVDDGAKLLSSDWDRASQFKPYGLKYRMVTAFTPTSSGKSPFRLEVFMLDSSISSFGIFASTRRVDSNFVTKLGNQGIDDGKQIRFWKGPLYAEITMTGDEAPPKGFLESVAKDVASRMVMTSRVPDLLSVLPGKGLISNSQKYGPFDGFGPKAPRLAVTAEYSISGANFRIATAQAASTNDATQAFQALRASVEAAGQLQQLDVRYGDEVFASALLADRVTFFVRQGPFIGMVENVAGETFASDTLKELADKMLHAFDQQELEGVPPTPSPAGGDVRGH